MIPKDRHFSFIDANLELRGYKPSLNDLHRIREGENDFMRGIDGKYRDDPYVFGFRRRARELAPWNPEIPPSSKQI